jgi:hypothetical protein
MTPYGIIETATELSWALDSLCEKEHAVHECFSLRPELPHWVKVECHYVDEGSVAYLLCTRCSEELKQLIITGALK